MSEPAWSVIVPTYNRPEAARKCVASLAGIEPPPGGFEIVVVDDGGMPACDLGRLPANTKIVRQSNRGPGAARNHGASLARGDYLAFTDDDCTVASNWLLEHHKALSGRTKCLSGGTTVNGLTKNLCSAASQLLVTFFEEWETQYGALRFVASNNIAIARRDFEAMGGFPDGFPHAAAEDRAFCDAWTARGGVLVRSPALVTHWHDLTPASFFRQHFNYGRGARRLYRRRETLAQGGGDPLRNRPAFTIQLLRRPFVHDSPGRATMICLLLIASQIATAAGYLSGQNATAGPQPAE